MGRGGNVYFDKDEFMKQDMSAHVGEGDASHDYQASDHEAFGLYA